MLELFDLETALATEAERRLALLGSLIEESEFNYIKFRYRRWETGIPIEVLNKWHARYVVDGEDGLRPIDWEPLSEKLQKAAMRRYEAICSCGDETVIDNLDDCLAEIAQHLGVAISTAWRWLRRYRIGGLWGLTAPYNPLKKSKKKAPATPRDIGSLDESELGLIYKRREMLGNLAEKPQVTQAEMVARATDVGVSVRTLWNYRQGYQQFGLAGLARKKRKDAGTQLSPKMEKRITGLRLKYSSYTLKHIHTLAVEMAQQLEEDIPSEWQVNEICRAIPEKVFLYGTGRKNQFRNGYQVTYTITFNGVVYIIDHTLIDVLVKDLRSKKYRTKSGMVRLWVTNCLEANSRCVPAYRFSYDQPNRHHVGAVIRDSILNHPGGIPDEIWVDGGKDLTSKHVRELTRELGIQLVTPKKKGSKKEPREPKPQIRGRVERFFGTLNTRLWSTLPGYTGSNVQERPPNVVAELTPEQLISEYEEFLEEYHNEPHSVLTEENGGVPITPLEYWRENCFAPQIEDERLLDILLLESETRTVQKGHIRFGNRQFWHLELAPLSGESVMIRVDTRFKTPDEIEVFHKGKWVCTAFATNSERGKAVTGEDVAEAKKYQRKAMSKITGPAKRAASEGKRAVEKVKEEKLKKGSKALRRDVKRRPNQTRGTRLEPKKAKKDDVFLRYEKKQPQNSSNNE